MAPVNDPNGVGVAELARQVQQVVDRFTDLANKLETQFLRRDNFDLYKELIEANFREVMGKLSDMASKSGVDASLKDHAGDLDKKASKGELEGLTKRVADLEDDKKWLTRIILTFVVMGVLTAVFVAAKAGGGA